MGDQTAIALGTGAVLRISTRSGKVAVIAESRADVLVDKGADIRKDIEGGLTLVGRSGGSQNVTARVPEGVTLAVGTASGSIRLRGPLGATSVTSESGSIDVERAGALDVRSLSGRVSVGRATGPCRIQTRSGRATVMCCDDRAEVSTESGRVELSRAGGDVRVRTTHGRVEVTATAPRNVAVQTLSGHVKIALPRGTKPKVAVRSVNGSLSTNCEEGDDCQVAVQTLSGSIEVVPA